MGKTTGKACNKGGDGNLVVVGLYESSTFKINIEVH